MSLFQKKQKSQQPEQRSLPSNPVSYPSGTCVRTPSGIYYINGKFKQKITSEWVLASWAFYNVIETSDEALSLYKMAGKLPVRNGTLVRYMSHPDIYLIVDGLKCVIDSPAILDRLQLTEADAILLSAEEYSLNKDGDKIK